MGLVSILFSFHGRITRLQYWLGNLVVGVGAVIIGVMATFVTASMVGDDSKEAMATGVIAFSLILLLISLATIWCGLALQVKRFHDRGRSGFWVLASFIPGTVFAITSVAAVMAGTLPDAGFIGPLLGFMWLVNFAMFIDLGLMPSAESKKYDGGPTSGPSPLSPKADARANKAVAASAALFGGAEQAMERAIEQQRRAVRQPGPASPNASPNAAPAFGRRGAS